MSSGHNLPKVNALLSAVESQKITAIMSTVEVRAQNFRAAPPEQNCCGTSSKVPGRLTHWPQPQRAAEDKPVNFLRVPWLLETQMPG